MLNFKKRGFYRRCLYEKMECIRSTLYLQLRGGRRERRDVRPRAPVLGHEGHAVLAGVVVRGRLAVQVHGDAHRAVVGVLRARRRRPGYTMHIHSVTTCTSSALTQQHTTPGYTMHIHSVTTCTSSALTQQHTKSGYTFTQNTVSQTCTTACITAGGGGGYGRHAEARAKLASTLSTPRCSGASSENQVPS